MCVCGAREGGHGLCRPLPTPLSQLPSCAAPRRKQLSMVFANISEKEIIAKDRLDALAAQNPGAPVLRAASVRGSYSTSRRRPRWLARLQLTCQPLVCLVARCGPACRPLLRPLRRRQDGKPVVEGQVREERAEGGNWRGEEGEREGTAAAVGSATAPLECLAHAPTNLPPSFVPPSPLW